MIPDLPPIAWAAIILGGLLLLVVSGYSLFAPWLSHINGERFKKEAGPLADAEQSAWKTYHEDGTFPGVDEKTLKQPGWENARITEKTKAFK